MNSTNRFVQINNIKLPVNASVSEAFSIAKSILKRADLLGYANEYSVYRRSVDARRKDDISFVYSVSVSGIKKMPPESVMKANGFYAGLYHSQFS